MRLAEIVGGVVVNVVEVDASQVPGWASDYVDIGTVGGPGWSYDGQVFSPPADPGPDRAGMELSFAQLLIGLETEGWITTAEADSWLLGTLPAPVLALIAGLPSDQQFAAKARSIRPSAIERLNPLVVGLAGATGKTDAELDDFFLTYAAV